MSRENFLTFGAPQITEDEIAEVVATLRSGWIGTGPKTSAFETAFARYRGAAHAVAVNSCTAALQLALVASGVGPGDEVITTAMTFCATVNAIIHSGATPILADVNPVTMNIDPAEIERQIGPRTRALIVVHFAGRPCDMEAILGVCKQYNLKLIEDCAHAIESEWRGQSLGTFGDFGCFSFYVTKNITTGEGGMILTASADAAIRVKQLALHGLSADAWKRYSDVGYKHYYVMEAGFKFNMMDLQAAIGLRQLEKVERYWQRRLQIWQRYEAAFADLPVVGPAVPEAETRHGLHLYTLRIAAESAGVTRDVFLNRVAAEKIGVGVHYLSIPEHPYYSAAFGWRPEDYPQAQKVGRETVSLPLSARLTDADVEDVIAAVRTALAP